MNTFFAHTTLRLQSHTFTIPWLRSVHSTSSAIVRCAQNDPQVPVSLSSLQKKKHKGVINIDSDLKRPISVCENASESRIPKTVQSNESTRSRNKEIIKTDLQSVEQVAIQLLAARAISISELRKKLLSKKFPLNVVNKAIVDLKDRGLVNDGLYAETFSRSRWLSVTWGPRRIKQALIQKGISEAEVDKATKKVFELDDNNENESTDAEPNNNNQNMSQSSMDRLFIQASKQWLKGGQDLSSQNRKGRIIRWLQYRGFNWSVISVILTRLQSQYCNVNDNNNDDNNNNNDNNDNKNNNNNNNNGVSKTKRGGGSREKETKELSEEGLDKLFGEVSKQWIKGQDVPMEKRRARIVRWLQYRGHKWDVIGDMLERLKSKFPP